MGFDGDGKGKEFYLDTDGSLFTTGTKGHWPVMVFMGGGWKPYTKGVNVFTMSKISEDDAREVAAAIGS